METLKEFHRLEMKTLEESFDRKDYEQLLMDANRELSLNVQNSSDLQRQLLTLSEENIQLSGLQEEMVKQLDENKMLRKDLPWSRAEGLPPRQTPTLTLLERPQALSDAAA
ncbi:hypothetical protein O3P69_008934 [Scylla paramamosain]|uniref:Uncharacterized protein n=1 Tax=Scylla paramamosain TaxID=85552 RepID=A0AAW0TSD7_SCYPA